MTPDEPEREMEEIIGELRTRKVERRGFDYDRPLIGHIGRGEYCDVVPDPLCNAAADEIVRLRRAVAEGCDLLMEKQREMNVLISERDEARSALESERAECAKIALAIDSGRGNEREIARAIRARTALQASSIG